MANPDLGRELPTSPKKKETRVKEAITVTLDDDPTMHQVIQAATGIKSLPFTKTNDLINEAKNLHPVAAFIDIHLDNFSTGLEILPTLRKQWPDCPLIVITSDLADSAVSEALAGGADDFVRKPINSTEILARLQLRMSGSHKREKKTLIRLGDISFDAAHSLIKGKTNHRYLSPISLNILQTLVASKGETVSRQQLKTKAWGKFEVTDNALDRKLSDLRKTLSEVSQQVQIETIYGKGFLLKLGENKKSEYELENGTSPAQSTIPTTAKQKFEGPLTDIIETTQNLFKTQLTDEQKKYAERIQSSAKDLLAVMNENNTIEKIDLEAIELHVREITEEVGNLFDKASPASLLDPQTKSFLEELARNEKDFLPSLTKLFFENVPQVLGKLGESVASEDVESSMQAAHQLKGLCLNVGAEYLSRICESIELRAKKGSLEGAEEKIRLLQNAYPEVKQALEKWQKEFS